jgi:hypothetical protein
MNYAHTCARKLQRTGKLLRDGDVLHGFHAMRQQYNAVMPVNVCARALGIVASLAFSWKTLRQYDMRFVLQHSDATSAKKQFVCEDELTTQSVLSRSALQRASGGHAPG